MEDICYYVKIKAQFDVIIISFGLKFMQRLNNISHSLTSDPINGAKEEELSLLDNRTGKSVKIKVKESKDCYFIDAKDVGKLKDSKG